MSGGGGGHRVWGVEDGERPREDKGAGVGKEWALEVAGGDRRARGRGVECGGGKGMHNILGK